MGHFLFTCSDTYGVIWHCSQIHFVAGRRTVIMPTLSYLSQWSHRTPTVSKQKLAAVIANLCTLVAELKLTSILMPVIVIEELATTQKYSKCYLQSPSLVASRAQTYDDSWRPRRNRNQPPSQALQVHYRYTSLLLTTVFNTSVWLSKFPTGIYDETIEV